MSGTQGRLFKTLEEHQTEIIAEEKGISVEQYTMELAFPNVDPGARPSGSYVLCQLRSTRSKSKGGVILIDETKDIDKFNSQVARVIAMGPLAYRNRQTFEPWPEGRWCEVGQYVRVPKYGGDRWEVPVPDAEGALFVIFNDLDIRAVITGDPRDMIAYV